VDAAASEEAVNKPKSNGECAVPLDRSSRTGLEMGENTVTGRLVLFRSGSDRPVEPDQAEGGPCTSDQIKANRR
jgi:hypothetical protein